MIDDVVSFKKRPSRLGELPDGMQDIPEPPALAPAPLSRPLDGRSLNATGRTQAFGLRVTPEFADTVRRIAQEDRIKMVEVLERALELLLKKRDSS